MKIKMNKPEFNQEVYILFNGELYTGKVFEIWDTPNANSEGIYFVFDSIIENQVYSPPSEFCIGGIIKQFVVRSCNKQFNPHPTRNINWTNYSMFGSAFIFESKEIYEKHILDTKKINREYHLKQAELYK